MMRSLSRYLLVGTGLALAAGCPGREVSRVDPNQAKEQQTKIPVSVNRNIDILFVVDDSGSMRQEQEALTANFPKFIEVLEGIEGGLPNVHIGVISSNVGTGPVGGGGTACTGNGDNGILQVPAACPALTDGKRFIIDTLVNAETGDREFNYSGSLEAQFSCMAQLGTAGCGFEQHLESVRRALTNNSENAGFLRDDAFLAIIFIQDEDDCSAKDRTVFDPSQDDRMSELGELSSFRCFEFGTVCEPADERTLGPRQNCEPDENSQYMESITTYVDFLKNLKDDPSKVIVAAITGDEQPVAVGIDPEKDELWAEPVCVVCPDGSSSGCTLDPNDPSGALVSAAPSVRMRSFLDAFPQRSTWQNICNYNASTGQVDFSGALTQIAVLLKTVVGNPCIEGNLVEPIDCSVSDVRNLGQDNQEEFPIPSCDNSGPPCWELVPDDSCDTATGLSLEIDRGGSDPPAETTVVARCLAE